MPRSAGDIELFGGQIDTAGGEGVFGGAAGRAGASFITPMITWLVPPLAGYPQGGGDAPLG